MNELKNMLREQTIKQEEQLGPLSAKDKNRLKLHLMPRTGWMNDPNGLCQMRGIYHVFFQYSPLDARGGMKAWRHFTSKDLLNWEWHEAPLYPDMPFDKDGVYSGSACIVNDIMYLFYTGNVKEEGNHDFILSGRQANTVLVTSKDGEHFSEKELLMTNADYPEEYTCHIRDPKIWNENDTFYMLQGGRKKGDKGAALLFTSKDLRHWAFYKEITTEETFGYMWECPDYFEIQGEKLFSCSPQGLNEEEYRYQSVYQSGYFKVNGNIDADCTLEDFTEWDMGFDFYAPQTFEDEKGRRILIGWAGIPDAEYDNQPTVDQGWQHALTFPREITVANGKVLQNPVQEILSLRCDKKAIPCREFISIEQEIFELDIKKDGNASCQLEYMCGQEKVIISHKEGILSLALTKEAGRGREIRKVKVEQIEQLQIFADTSLMEVYINQGEIVLTTRFYFPEENRSIIIVGSKENILWNLSEMKGL